MSQSQTVTVTGWDGHICSSFPPELLGDVLPSLHHTHEGVEGDEDGRADEELVQKHLLDDGDRGLAHEPSVQPEIPVVQDHGEHQRAQDPVPRKYNH